MNRLLIISNFLTRIQALNLSTSYDSFMQPEIFLHSQEPSLGTYHQPEKSRPGTETADYTST
jgi:hypothetical protein